MRKCVLCGVDFTPSNDSREHIIPNALGGKKKVKGFICEDCNVATGRHWDSKLSKSLSSQCLYFRIERERKNVPRQILETTDGDKILLCPDGKMYPEKPKVNITQTAAGYNISCTMNTEGDLRKTLKNIKKKKLPDLDVDAVMLTAEHQKKYPDYSLKISFDFSDKNAQRSIVKSALAMCSSLGVDCNSCEQAISFLKNDDAASCLGFYYETNFIVNRPTGVPLHCVAVHGDPSTGALLGYVEYFGYLRILINLSNQYHGQIVDGYYAIDPTSGEKLRLDVEFNLTPGGNIPAPDLNESIRKSSSEIFSATQLRHQTEELANLLAEDGIFDENIECLDEEQLRKRIRSALYNNWSCIQKILRLSAKKSDFM